jgi:hypothetical protein
VSQALCGHSGEAGRGALGAPVTLPQPVNACSQSGENTLSARTRHVRCQQAVSQIEVCYVQRPSRACLIGKQHHLVISASLENTATLFTLFTLPHCSRYYRLQLVAHCSRDYRLQLVAEALVAEALVAEALVAEALVGKLVDLKLYAGKTRSGW